MEFQQRSADNILDRIELQERTQLVAEVQAIMQQFYNQIIVIKYGGSTFKTDSFESNILDDISILHKSGIKPIIVHGGGPSITEETKLRGIETKFVDGQRVTDEETLNLTEMVLSGKVNKNIVGRLNNFGIDAVGLSGKDGKTIIAKKKYHKEQDIGFVGEIVKINTKMLEFLLTSNYVPVISPIGIGEDNQTYNINADNVAAAVKFKVSSSVTLCPSTNFVSIPLSFVSSVILGPPPCTIIGFIPDLCKIDISSKILLSKLSVLKVEPPYLITII